MLDSKSGDEDYFNEVHLASRTPEELFCDHKKQAWYKLKLFQNGNCLALILMKPPPTYPIMFEWVQSNCGRIDLKWDEEHNHYSLCVLEMQFFSRSSPMRHICHQLVRTSTLEYQSPLRNSIQISRISKSFTFIS
jgi:hypothetical protein